MKEHEGIRRIPNLKSEFVSLPALFAAAALGLSAAGAYAQLIITPDLFSFQTWGDNFAYSTVGAYPGDGPRGYPYTLNYGSTPSATINIPLTGLAAGWNAYNIYEWNPIVTSQYHVLNIINNGIGYGNPIVFGEPWPGQFGTQQQYLKVNGSPAGQWVELGPGPQSDPNLDGGYGVWINGSGVPSYLQFHYGGFENGEETFDAIAVVPMGMAFPVPEPSALALGLLGGFALLAKRSLRLKLRVIGQ